MNVASLVVSLSTDTAKFTAGIATAKTSIMELAGSAAGAAAAAAQLGFSALKAGADMLIGMVNNTMDVVEAQKDMASQLGMSSEALTRLQYTADINGSSVGAMNTALGKMNQNLGLAAMGGGPAAAALERLGLDAQRLAMMAPDQAFAEIAEKVSLIQNPAERAATAVQIFGKSGQNILNVLMMGKAGIAAFAAEADRLGITLLGINSEKIGAAKDAIDKVKAVLGGIAVKITAELAPFIEFAANKFAEFAGTALTSEQIVPVLRNIAIGVGHVIDFVETLAAAFLGAGAMALRMGDYATLGFTSMGAAADKAAQMADTLLARDESQAAASLFDTLRAQADAQAKMNLAKNPAVGNLDARLTAGNAKVEGNTAKTAENTRELIKATNKVADGVNDLATKLSPEDVAFYNYN